MKPKEKHKRENREKYSVVISPVLVLVEYEIRVLQTAATFVLGSQDPPIAQLLLVYLNLYCYSMISGHYDSCMAFDYTKTEKKWFCSV